MPIPIADPIHRQAHRGPRRGGGLAWTGLLALLVACGAPLLPDPDPDPDPPPAPAVTTLGTGFPIAPTGVAFTAPFAVAPPEGGADDVACRLELDGAVVLEVPAPCGDGEVVLGPFAAGGPYALSLTATTAEGGTVSATWTFNASRWAPFQRLEGIGAVRAIAGSDARLAVLRDADEHALAVYARPYVPPLPGAWAPTPVALEAVLPRGRGAAIAWNRQELAWMSEVEEAFIAIDRFVEDEGAWVQSRMAEMEWPAPFEAPRLAISDVLTVIGDGESGDTGRWWARHDRLDGWADETSDLGDGFPTATPGDRAGAAVAALGDVLLVGAPEAGRYEGDLAFLAPNGRVLAARAGDSGWETVGGGFGSGPGARIGEHLAVVWTGLPTAFMAGATNVTWARMVTRPPSDDDEGAGEEALEVVGELAEAETDAAWIAVNRPPVDPDTLEGVLAAALLAVGRPDGTVAVYLVPLAPGFDAIPVGTLPATGATGPGAWVGGALALPYGDAVWLFDLAQPSDD